MGVFSVLFKPIGNALDLLLFANFQRVNIVEMAYTHLREAKNAMMETQLITTDARGNVKRVLGMIAYQNLTKNPFVLKYQL